MAKYPLRDLLSARAFREEAAEREVGRAASAVEEAKEAARLARERYEEYRLWRPEEEKRLFGEVRYRHLSQGELDGHQGDIQRLRQAELRHEEEAIEAERRVVRAEEVLAAARSALAAAVRDKRKIEEHRERWLRGEAIRLDMAEESELEDFTVPAAPDDEAAGADEPAGDELQ